MPEIMKVDVELRKILTNGQRTEEQEIKIDTLVMGNVNLEMRVKGEPHHFKDFIPGTLLTVSFTQSQTSITDFDKNQDEDELIQPEADALKEEQGIKEEDEEETEDEAVRRQSEEENEEELEGLDE